MNVTKSGVRLKNQGLSLLLLLLFATLWRAVRLILSPTLKRFNWFDRKKKGVPPIFFQAPVVTPLTKGEVLLLNAQNGD